MKLLGQGKNRAGDRGQHRRTRQSKKTHSKGLGNSMTIASWNLAVENSTKLNLSWWIQGWLAIRDSYWYMSFILVQFKVSIIPRLPSLSVVTRLFPSPWCCSFTLPFPSVLSCSSLLFSWALLAFAPFLNESLLLVSTHRESLQIGAKADNAQQRKRERAKRVEFGQRICSSSSKKKYQVSSP